jgi:hypothetical protein
LSGPCDRFRTRHFRTEENIDPSASTPRRRDLDAATRALCRAPNDIETESGTPSTRTAPLHNGQVGETRSVIRDRQHMDPARARRHHDLVSDTGGGVCEHIFDEDVDHRTKVRTREGYEMRTSLDTNGRFATLLLCEDPPKARSVIHDVTEIDGINDARVR